MKRAFLGLLLLGCKGTIVNGGAGGGGGGGTTDPSDRTAPVLVVMTPERGTMADDASVMVSGRARDDQSGIASFTINGQDVTVAADGSFHVDVPLVPGLTILETRLTDRGGNLVRDVRAVMSGTLSTTDEMTPNAVAGKIGPGAFGVLGQMVSRYANGVDLMSLVGNTRMVDEGGSCLGVEVDLRSITKGAVTMQMVPQAGALGANLEVSDLRVELRASWDVACIGGGTTIRISANRMRLDGSLGMALSGEQLAVSVPDLNVSFDGFNLDVGGVPGVIVDLIEGTVEDAASDAIEDALRGMIPGQAQDLLSEFVAGTWEVSIVDRTATVAIRPSQLSIDATGAMIALDARIGVSGGEGAMYLTSPASPPASIMSDMSGLGIGLSDDIANQLFAGMWASRALEQTIELGPDHPGRIFFGEVPDEIQVELMLPPTIDADESGTMRLEIGDLLLKLIDTNQGLGTTAVIALSATVDFAVDITADGRLALTTNNPRSWAQIVEQTEAQDPQLDADVVESLGGVIMAQVEGLADEALSGLPIPIIGDAMASGAEALSGGGYVVLRANLSPPP